MTSSPKSNEYPILLRLAGLWLIFCGWTAVSGWGLSMVGALNGRGYLVASVALLASGLWWWRFSAPSSLGSRRYGILRRQRLRQPFVLLWIAMCGLVFAGGLVYPPTNYDALTYRLPRILYWLQEHHWFWIGALNARMDIASTGMEWMSVPLILLTGGGRLLYLLNFIPFLLLPGLFYTIAIQMGISPRHARWWMWIWPYAYGLALQAGAIGNDMIGAPLALAAVAFALHAQSGRNYASLFFSALSIAILSGMKVTMIPVCVPLALLWIHTAYKLLGIAAFLRFGTVAFLAVIPVSILPSLALNVKHTRSWSGNPDNVQEFELADPLVGITGNGLHLIYSVIQPPVMPNSSTLNARVVEKLGNSGFYHWIADGYPNYSFSLGKEIPAEESAGVGLGLSFVCLAWLLFGFGKNRPCCGKIPKAPLLVFLGITIFALLLISKATGNSCPRFLLPATPFLIFALLAITNRSRHPFSEKRCLLRAVPALAVLPAILLNPGRPLLPVSSLAEILPLSPSLEKRISDVYGTYSTRADALAPIAAKLPQNAEVLFAGNGDQSALSLMFPLGQRRVGELNASPPGDRQWIVGTAGGIQDRTGLRFEDWLRKHDLEPSQPIPIVFKVSEGPLDWYLIKPKRELHRSSN